MITKHWLKTAVGLLACVILFAVLPLKCLASGSDEIDFAKIDEYVMNQMKQTDIPGLSIGIVKENTLLYVKGYGNASTGRSVTAQTPFEIGSVSKSFTALAIMQLVEKGSIELDSPVEKYLPWFKAGYRNKPAVITIRQLLNQNSGVPTFFDNDAKAEASIEQVVKENLNNLKLVNSPGTEFLYSNANYNILGEIVQVVSGLSYKEYIEKNIFTPLEMGHSYVSKEEAKKNGLADGYRTWFGFPVKADLPYFEGNIPSGHIISCAEDMCHYLSALLSGGKYEDRSILSSEGVKMLMAPSVKTPVPLDADAAEVYYAMGWGVNFKNDKIDVIEHTGETSNYHSHAVIKPQEKIGIIEMDNVGGFITAGQIAPGVIKLLFNEQASTSKGPGGFIWIFNVFYIAIAALLMLSIVRLRSFKRRIAKSKSRFVFNTLFTLFVNLILPILFILGEPAMSGATWKATLIFSPDISLVLITTSIVLFAIGVFKMICILRNNAYRTQAAANSSSRSFRQNGI